VLLGGRKVAGILVESAWAGNEMEAAVIGVGVNVKETAVPPPTELNFPATSIEAELQRDVNCTRLLHETLKALIAWRSKIGTPEFMEAWEQALAFRGEEVIVMRDGEVPVSGKLAGLEADGSLQLAVNGNLMPIRFGEVSLRSRNARMGSVPGGPYV
jgi:BirA family biotin operon repressor/biotin-[acetyl-CoA-carboxylase] ligase